MRGEDWFKVATHSEDSLETSKLDLIKDEVTEEVNSASLDESVESIISLKQVESDIGDSKTIADDEIVQSAGELPVPHGSRRTLQQHSMMLSSSTSLPEQDGFEQA